MSLFVDTSVWSLALRRDGDQGKPEVARLNRALTSGELVVTTGIVLQELLQGFDGPRARQSIISGFTALPMLVPDRDDYIAAAEVRNVCRRGGVQIGTIDALIARLCLRHDRALLTTDADFSHAAQYVPLRVWRPAASV